MKFKYMILSNNSDKEKVINFYDSLSVEKQTFMLSLDEILNSLFIVILLFDDSVLGLSGIRKKYGFPLFYIVVKEENQGKGYGKTLIKILFKICRIYKLFFILLTVKTDNFRAIGLYEKYGFKKIFMKKDSFIYIKFIN